MFTLQQIKEAHSKVKTGADFPKYIIDLKELGVKSYDTFVSDGRTDYFGENNFKITSDAKYPALSISENVNPELFKSDLKNHQQGNTDYSTFCGDCAKSGIEKWSVSMDEMTCTYFDRAGNEVLEEKIPQ